MKLTIIVPDSAVYINGESRFNLNLTPCAIPSDVHALQWNETTGWIEFNMNPDGSKHMNETISALPDWANACISVWEQNPPPAPVDPTANIPKVQ